MENKLKKKLLKGEPAIACWLSMGSPIAAEVVANAGYDAMVIDHEHGPGDLLNAISLIQASAEVGLTCMMRVPWNDMVYIKRALDIGVEGIIVPYVQNAAEAQAAVDACHYPSAGLRGVAPHAARCSRWGVKLDDYLKSWPESLLLACQIETAEAMQNIDEIAAVDGVDMLFLGPSDISASIGHLGHTDHPEAVALMAEAERRMRKTGKLLATVTRPGKTLNWTFGRGYHLVVCGSDFRLLQDAANAQVRGFRANPPARAGRVKAPPRRAKARRTKTRRARR